MKQNTEEIGMQVEELIQALDYIEANIKGEIFIQDIADYCYSSLSGLQKTFKYVFHLSINEYILRRKFSCAAMELLNTDQSILEIALAYGYSSAESFSRGFKKVWHVSPSEFRRTRKFSGHTPKFSVNAFEIGGDTDMRMKFDLTELYDVLQDRKNNAYVCADLCRLKWINDNLGHEAGDEALLELMRRVEAACSDDDIFLRIGGDEFVVLTNSEDMSHANDIVAKVNSLNGKTVKCGDTEFPVDLHIGAFKQNYTYHVNADTMFSNIAQGIRDIHS